MNTQQQLPAGLVDENVEVFIHDNSLKATYSGRVMDFKRLPVHIINQFYDLLIDDEEAREEFLRHKVMDMDVMLKEYVRCNFGGWDRTPDLVNGSFNREYWSCPRRGECPYNEKICPKLEVENGKLSRKEIDIIRLIAQGMTYDQMGDRLNKSPYTVQTQARTIHKKLGVQCAAEVTAFAFRNNLVV
mgnify:CR=1 FL=1